MTPPPPTSVLSIDFGLKRIGLAGCDSLGITVTPLEPLFRSDFISEVEYLKILCTNRNVKGLIVGVPLDENGLSTSQSKYCKNYGLQIAKELNLPLAWVNEHSSTWEAKKRFNLQKDRTGKLDSASAVILLEQWLKEGPKLESLN